MARYQRTPDDWMRSKRTTRTSAIVLLLPDALDRLIFLQAIEGDEEWWMVKLRVAFRQGGGVWERMREAAERVVANFEQDQEWREVEEQEKNWFLGF